MCMAGGPRTECGSDLIVFSTKLLNPRAGNPVVPHPLLSRGPMRQCSLDNQHKSFLRAKGDRSRYSSESGGRVTVINETFYPHIVSSIIYPVLCQGDVRGGVTMITNIQENREDTQLSLLWSTMTPTCARQKREVPVLPQPYLKQKPCRWGPSSCLNKPS